MAIRYNFKSSGGLHDIPVADGDFYIDQMNSIYSLGVCALEFLDAQKEPVTPTGGTITFKSAPIGEQWHAPSNGTGIINAVDVVAGDSGYTMPTFNGPVIKSKMTLSGITGASYVRAYHWRDE